MNINVTCVQMYPKTGDFDNNLARMRAFVDAVMAENPETRLIVFPELATIGYEATKEEFQSLAETLPDGKSMEAMGKLCAAYGIHVVYGFAERDAMASDVLYNSAVLIDDCGNVLGSYRKVHPFDTEKQWCRPGCSYPVFETSIGKLGIMICWDTAFPEVARSYALKGTELLVVPTNWEKPYADDWDLITRARAFDNTLPLVSANRIGDDKTLGFFGHSRIISPTGAVIASLDDEVEGTVSAEIDLAQSLRERVSYYTFFKDRRPDTYGELVRKY
ncbi:MAG: carbon-nitrogen hydrolase family protein [Clostridiales bacterium]|nr:carbon-nitrogen hydrolase family protein [Clostridiales bacterium]